MDITNKLIHKQTNGSINERSQLSGTAFLITHRETLDFYIYIYKYKMLTHHFSYILCEYIKQVIPANLPMIVMNKLIRKRMWSIKWFQCFLITHRQTLNLSVCYLETSEPPNRLHSFMGQFVHYIHWKVCGYQVFNIIAQYVWKIMR